jgi:alanine racemase
MKKNVYLPSKKSKDTCDLEDEIINKNCKPRLFVRLIKKNTRNINSIFKIEKNAFEGKNLLNYWSLVPYFQVGHIFGLFENNSLKGFAIFTRMWDNPKRVYLVEIGIDDECQGNGYGSFLLLKSFFHLQDNGISTVCLTVDPNNKRNLHFYEKFGFEVVESRKNEYGQGLDRLFIELDLEKWVGKKQKFDHKKAICSLSTDNLLHNLKTIQEAAPHAKIMAILKSNAYGHGRIPVSKILEKNKVGALGLTSIYDAIKLREEGINTQITLIEGVFSREELELAAENGFYVVFHDYDQIGWLNEGPLPCKLHAWLKIDTGMGRLGFAPKKAEKVMNELSQNRSIYQPIGILSHFACADNPEHPLNTEQKEAFLDFIEKCPPESEKCFCNSAAIFAFPEMQFDWVRPGLALYGGNPFPRDSVSDIANDLEKDLKQKLRPVMTFKTKLWKIKIKAEGENAGGYGAEYLCSKGSRIGIAPVGYSHGYPRTTQNDRNVLINETLCPVIRPVMMDMTLIDLSNCPDAEIGNDVILWGEGLPIEDVATDSGRISYDLLCGVGVDRHTKIMFEWKPKHAKSPYQIKRTR